MNDQREEQIRQIMTDLTRFVKDEMISAKQIPVKTCKKGRRIAFDLQDGHIFLRINRCNDWIALGIKMEAYSTHEGISFDGHFAFEHAIKQSMRHTDKRTYPGVMMRSRLSASGNNEETVRECKEFILYVLQKCTGYMDGPYRRSEERVRVTNLLN